MPAYSQPMMSAGQMPHDDVTNQQSVNTHTDACGEQYVGAAETDFIGSDEYYSTDAFVPVSDAADAVDNCSNEELISDRLVRRYFFPV